MKVSTLAIATLLAVSVFGQSSKGDNSAGAGVFQAQCVGCHGPDGRAQTEMGKKIGAADLTAGAVQQQSDSQLATIVHDGKKKMPSFADKLSSDEIRAVIAYIRELARKQ